MKIAIIGAGAIGLLTGAYAALSGTDVTFFSRTKEQAKKLADEGLFLHRDNSIERVDVSAFTFGEYDFSTYDVILIAVKQYSLRSILSSLASLDVACPLIFMQNGIAQIDYAKQWEKYLPSIAIIEHGAMRTSENTVVHTGNGQIQLGSFGQTAQAVKQLCEKLNEVHFRIVETKNWQMILEYKLLANAVINPLTALFRVKNGMLIKNGSLHKISKRLFQEAHSIFEHLDKQEAWQYVKNVIEKTANNRSSMLADCEAKRQTEIEAISGYILKAGKQRGKDLPFTEFVYESICSIEEESRRSYE